MNEATQANDNPDHGCVHASPRRWLRLDGLTLLAAAIALFASTGQPWWLLPTVILLPDLFMVGYLCGTRTGASVYNLGHTYLLPSVLSLAAAADHHPLLLAIGLLWLGHIGMDRALGYGIKYSNDFTHTRLGRLAGNPRHTAVPHSTPGDVKRSTHSSIGA